MRRALLAFALALAAGPLAAQETGTPVFLAPYRAFEKMEFGAMFSDPGVGERVRCLGRRGARGIHVHDAGRVRGGVRAPRPPRARVDAALQSMDSPAPSRGQARALRRGRRGPRHDRDQLRHRGREGGPGRRRALRRAGARRGSLGPLRREPPSAREADRRSAEGSATRSGRCRGSSPAARRGRARPSCTRGARVRSSWEGGPPERRTTSARC